MTVDEIEEINDQLDVISDKTYQSQESAWCAVTECLERAGLQCPCSEEAFQDLQDNELLFKVDENSDDTPFFLYVIIDPEGDKYEMFATIATQQDLDALNAFMDDMEEND